MSIIMEYPSSSMPLSSEELTWLQASAFIDCPPTPPPKDDDAFVHDLSASSSTSSMANNFPLTQSPPPHLRHKLSGAERNSSSSLAYLNGSAGSATPPPVPKAGSPRSEWIYRRPKSPASVRQRTANPRPYSRPQPRVISASPPPPPLSRSRSTASTRTTRSIAHASTDQSLINNSTPSSNSPLSLSTGPFWSTILRPRSRSERSMPLLKTIPSESQIVLTPLSTPKRMVSPPKPMFARPPSISSTLSSVSTSNSPASSRSESPVTPVSISPSPYGRYRRQNLYHRRHRPQLESESSLAPLSSSCPPSKSILTRTASVSTKASSHTVNKSVKFAAIPIVHYASTGYWDLETVDRDASNMGINVDEMDMGDPFASCHSRLDAEERIERLEIAKLRELQCATPTPEREREKNKGLKRLMSLSRKPGTPTGPTINIASVRPVISTPYALGAYPTLASMQSTTSLQTTRNTRGDSDGAGPGGSAPVLNPRGVPLRSAPSYESFRSAKSSAARSVRSMGSVKSTASTKGLRGWLRV
ncbi:unnamed protein product [Cyclocybe aegerita]|uniref:Uncharacterized protein n=1 Tax=Cyclocybe aegerita TaxID=1973307 RepID=A0A8S0VQH5_CYCAE|nr:unnamed protein product [Cyclocybe aegerita]